jgi:hypothetical protein
MTTQQTDIKILRLNTGEDIIAECLLDDETNSVVVAGPMKVIISRVAEEGHTMLIMLPWLPLEIIDDNLATINYNDIITMVDPKESFVEYYYNTLDKYNALIEKRDQEGGLNFSDDLDEEELDDETLEEMLEVIKERKDKLLH